MMKKILLLLALILPVVAVAAEPEGKQKTRIGVILPLTGPFARYGERLQASILRENGNRADFIFENEGCDPKVALSAFKKLSEVDHVKLFLGPWCGSPQSVIAPLLKESDRFSLLGSSAPAEVYALSGGNMLSTQHTIQSESAFLAQKMNERGIKSVAIVFKENSFSRAHEAAFRVAFKGVIHDTFAYSSEDISELKSIALQVKKLKPEALYVPDAFPIVAGLLRELRYIRITTPIYSVYSVESDDVLAATGADGERLLYSYPVIEGGKEALDYFPALAAQLLTQAAEQCGEDAGCVRRFITGARTFDEYGALSGTFLLKTIRQGSFVPLK